MLTTTSSLGVEVKYEEIFQGIRLNDDRFDKLDIEIVVAVPPGRSTVVQYVKICPYFRNY